MGDLTASFTRAEFACKCGCKFDDIDIGLVNRLQVIRDIVKGPLVILSGCRCAVHNHNVGGKPESYHLRGMAADWHLGENNLMLKNLAEHLLKEWSGGLHYYPDQVFIHTDVRGYKARW